MCVVFAKRVRRIRRQNTHTPKAFGRHSSKTLLTLFGQFAVWQQQHQQEEDNRSAHDLQHTIAINGVRCSQWVSEFAQIHGTHSRCTGWTERWSLRRMACRRHHHRWSRQSGSCHLEWSDSQWTALSRRAINSSSSSSSMMMMIYPTMMCSCARRETPAKWVGTKLSRPQVVQKSCWTDVDAISHHIRRGSLLNLWIVSQSVSQSANLYAAATSEHIWRQLAAATATRSSCLMNKNTQINAIERRKGGKTVQLLPPPPLPLSITASERKKDDVAGGGRGRRL